MNKLQCKAAILPMLLIGMAFMFGCSKATHDRIHTDAAIKSVEARTSFDMDCEEVSSQRLGEITYLPGTRTLASMNIGVKGCNKKAVYFAECILVSDWGEGEANCTPKLNTLTGAKKFGEDNEEDSSQGD